MLPMGEHFAQTLFHCLPHERTVGRMAGEIAACAEQKTLVRQQAIIKQKPPRVAARKFRAPMMRGKLVVAQGSRDDDVGENRHQAVRQIAVEIVLREAVGGDDDAARAQAARRCDQPVGAAGFLPAQHL